MKDQALPAWIYLEYGATHEPSYATNERLGTHSLDYL